jgi:hypothetical protein
MIKNSEREKQKSQEKQWQTRHAARWLSNFVDIVAVAADGTQRVLEGEEAVDAIIRQWEEESG